LRVIGTAGSPEGAEAVRAAGAHLVLDHSASGYLDGIAEVNIVVEMLANVNLMRDLDVLARGGRVVIVGNRGPLEFNPRAVMAKDADIRGFVLFNTPPAELRSIHAALFAGLENGTLKPVVAAEFALSDAAAAHEAVLGAGHKGKVVLAIDA
jgi:NADPH2:quinone reductase